MKAFSGANYSRNAGRVRGDDYPCVICGRQVKTATQPWRVRVDIDCNIRRGDDVLGTNSMGWFPIGADCLRVHPELKTLARRFGR